MDNKETEKVMGLRVINMEFNTNKPYVKKDRNKDWVTWGEDNLYPQYLIDLFHNKSITHKQIINRKVKMIASSGFEKPAKPSQMYINFIDNAFGDMTIEEMSIKLAFDLVLFNGICLNPHWNMDNSGITRLCYIPFERMRQDKFNTEQNDGLPKYMWMCNEWANWRKEEPVKYVKFNAAWEDEKSQIYYHMCIDQGVKWYPDVEYSPAVNYIDADYEIGNYVNNAIKNGFQAGFLLNFATGIPTEAEMDRAYEDIRTKFTGSSNANKFLLGWSNGIDGKPSLDAIPANSSDTKYLELKISIRDSILESHESVNPELFGIATPGKLGSRSELLESLAIYQSTYINNKQKVIEDILNLFAGLYGVDTVKEPIKLKKYVIDVPDTNAVPILTMGDLIYLTTSVTSGQITMDTAINIIVELYQFDRAVAVRLLQTSGKPASGLDQPVVAAPPKIRAPL